MKKKCEQCRGKGGYHKAVGLTLVYVSCFHCKGKGEWWTRNRPKSGKRKKG